MRNPFIVSIHIPKTAGTSLGVVYDRCFNRRVFYDYEDYFKPQVVSKAVADNARFIESHFKVVHGHFLAQKYFPVFPTAKYVAVLRHPVDRVISQYAHELNEHSSAAWYHNDIVSGKMSIVDFAVQDGIHDADSNP
jgi:hypothetical protein